MGQRWDLSLCQDVSQEVLPPWERVKTEMEDRPPWRAKGQGDPLQLPTA